MPLTFNMLLTDAGIAPRDVRLLRHQTWLPDGRTPFELLKAGPTVFDSYQGYQQHAQRARFASPWWATFVGLQDGRTLFAGLYAAGEPERIDIDRKDALMGKLIAAGTEDHYLLALSPLLGDYNERLYVDWGGGASGKRAWRQRADLQDKPIVELQRDAAMLPFPGLMETVAPLSMIGEAPTNWIAALSAARGVYLLTCPRTGEAYVGSAIGGGGFWSRWMEYRANGHGGNIALRGREPSDFLVSILQVAGSADPADAILAMEATWKRKLQSRRTGLNRN